MWNVNYSGYSTDWDNCIIKCPSRFQKFCRLWSHIRCGRPNGQNIRDRGRGREGGKEAALFNIAKTGLVLLMEAEDQDGMWRLPMSSQMSITGQCIKQWWRQQ